MTKTLSQYGWVVITVLILTVLLSFSGVYARYFMDTNETLAEEMTSNIGNYMEDAANAFKDKYRVIPVESAHGIIEINKEMYVEGEKIVFTVVKCRENYKLTAVEFIHENDNKITFDVSPIGIGESSTVVCPSSNISIIPVFSPVEGG